MWRTEHKRLFFLLFVASLCADAGGAEHIGASARGKHLSTSVSAKTPSCPSGLLHRARNGGQLHGREDHVRIGLRGGGNDRSEQDEGQVSEESLKNFDLETHLDELMATGDALIKQGEQLCARLGGTPYGAYDVRAEEDAGENDPGVKENAENIRAYIKEKMDEIPRIIDEVEAELERRTQLSFDDCDSEAQRSNTAIGDDTDNGVDEAGMLGVRDEEGHPSGASARDAKVRERGSETMALGNLESPRSAMIDEP